MEAIKIKNLHKTFKSLHKRQMAIDGINLSIQKGEIFGFLGPNGAGKSTTMKIITGFIKADNGEVLINGTDAALKHDKLGFLPENPSFIDNLTGIDILMFSCAMHNIDRNEAKIRSETTINLVGLNGQAGKQVRKYSKGMVSRLGLAAAIIHKPEILILDEPMSGVDPIGRHLFKQIIRQLNEEGTTIFFSSHIISDIEDICFKTAIVNKGKVVRIVDENGIKYLSTSGYKIIFSGYDKAVHNIADVKHMRNSLYYIRCKTDCLEISLHNIAALKLKVISIEPEKESLESIFIKYIAKTL